MIRNQFVFALSILTLCLCQPVLAQDSPEANKVVSKVPLRNFEGAWSEAQVREWANGPVKEWLDKAALFFSMIEPENWTHSSRFGKIVVESQRKRSESFQTWLSSGQIYRPLLLFQPYNLTATIQIYWSLADVGTGLYELGNLYRDSDFTGGPSPELGFALVNHSTEAYHLLMEFRDHIMALLRWHHEAVAAPRW